MARYSELATVKATKARLRQFGLRGKKSLGQHFLISDDIVGKIIRLANPAGLSAQISGDGSHGDLLQPANPAGLLGASSTVLAPSKGSPASIPLIIEVGPGIGTLTEALLATGIRVVAIEKDPRLLEVLREAFAAAIAAHQLEIFGADALDSACIVSLASRHPLALVANLPYDVAASLTLTYFLRLPSLQSATVMVQREVAWRMMARPGSKNYGAYSLKLQLLASPGPNFAVSPGNFFPPPRVQSTVLRLNRRPEALLMEPDLLQAAFTVIDAAFFHRRKTIANSMRAYFAATQLPQNLVDTLLQATRLSPRVRGETLSECAYLAMARALLAAR
ncbi:MAG: 16S rRNA (adenine(1518)-N(6)/adenine(1519)-N(6))-dimethyltransferase RsmA [Coriobacteriales bacterium]|nr:16S rRNA (adenine(1518)-N(6)/adenine(1519)-N(6))-dimethyltransferase RsmA [Coriobacteriales bacterium]